MPNVPYYPTSAPSQGLQAHGSYASATPLMTSFPSASGPYSALPTSAQWYISKGLKGSTTPRDDQWWCLTSSPCPYGFKRPLGDKELRKRSLTTVVPWPIDSVDHPSGTIGGAYVAQSAIPSPTPMLERDPTLISGVDGSPIPIASKGARYWTSIATNRARTAGTIEHDTSTMSERYHRLPNALGEPREAALSRRTDPDLPDLPGWERGYDGTKGAEDEEEVDDGDVFPSHHLALEKSSHATGGYPFVHPPAPPFVHPPAPRNDALQSRAVKKAALRVRDVVTVTHTTTVTRASTVNHYLVTEFAAPTQGRQARNDSRLDQED